MMDYKWIVLLFTVSFLLFGCATGKDSILFVTKTSIAIDVDTNPPTFDVGYGRYEGSIAPVVEDGQVLPLMTSISSEGGISSNVFGAGVAQNFGVGNAAIIMSKYIGTPDNPAASVELDFKELISKPASVKGNIQEGRRYFFGTKTNFGFTTSFAPERSYTPDSISLGYKRKEFAYVPIRSSNANKNLVIPSMLATASNSANSGESNSGFSVTQFYATGMAANFLAAHPVIRNSVISKIIGDDEVADKLEKAQNQAIKEIDLLSLQSDYSALQAKGKIDSMPAADLDNALQLMKDASVIESDDAFKDYDGDGTITDLEKRKRLISLSQTFGDPIALTNLNNWLSNLN